MSQAFERTKGATCRIECGGKSGTGYLVSGHRIVTCWHVVDEVAAGDPVTVTFPRRLPSHAFLTTAIDRVRDVAILEWREPIADIEPLRFGRTAERKTVWDGYGYPSLAFGQGLPIDGTIDDVAGTDRDHVTSLVLTADKLAAGLGAPPHGFSGSPVVVGGLVVGHLKRILEDNDIGGHVAFGTVYAARAEDFVAALLPGEALVDTVPDAGSPLPPTPRDGHDVFLSAAPDVFPRASALAQALRDRALDVYFPTADYVAGATFSDAVRRALQQSRAAVIVASPGWPDGVAFEAQLLWARRGSAFPVIPVLPDGTGLVAPWDDLRPLDLRGRGPTGPAFERLLYAIQGRPAPYTVVQADLGELLAKDDSPTVTSANARRLIAIGNPRRALELLPRSPADLEAKQLRALALSKSGRTDEAIATLESLRALGKLDGETGGILGGCYRRKYEKSKPPRREWLDKALDAYRDAFDRTGDPYPGINTASILLGVGDVAQARAVALRVLDAVGQPPPTGGGHWTHATVAEASLILGEVENAADSYRRAVRHDVDAVQDIAVMRRGARRALASLGRPAGELDPIFRVPRPVAFVGHGLDLPGQSRKRFPPDAVAGVRRAIGDALDRAGSSLGIASATVGGDTIFLEEILERDGRARVLLPCPELQFLDQFVVRADRKYEVRKVLRHERTEVIVVDHPTDPADIWSDFAPRLRERAAEWAAALDETPILIALWDGHSSFLETVIEQWQERHWEVDVLRLRDGTLRP